MVKKVEAKLSNEKYKEINELPKKIKITREKILKNKSFFICFCFGWLLNKKKN